MDMTTLKEPVFTHPPILLPQLILDVDLGTGTTRNVYNAQTDGHSTVTTFVSPFLTNAPQATKAEAALLATKDMT